MKNKGFRRGDVFMAELRAEPGSVEHGRRPVVILQNNIGNLYAPTLIVAPITSRPRKHGCQVTQYPVPPTTFLRDGSIVLLEQITTINKHQCRQYLGSFDARQMDAIRRCIEISIGQDVPERAKTALEGIRNRRESKRIKAEQEAAAGENELCKKRSSR